MVLSGSTGYTILNLFVRGFKKLVPMQKNSSAPAVETGGVLAIADDPKYWTPEKLSQHYHKFHNVATTFGPMVLDDNSIGYNHCLDVDSDAIAAILEPYMAELKRLTYLVKTKKGIHIHWIEHEQHERIGNVCAGRHVKRCTVGFEFEIKTDHKGGLAHLPPSLHRTDVKEEVEKPFQYYQLEGSADKVAIIDNFMDSGMGLYNFLMQSAILGEHVREPSPDNGGGGGGDRSSGRSRRHRAVARASMDSQVGDDVAIAPIPAAVSSCYDTKVPHDVYFRCADRIHSLVDQWYLKDHRNNAMLCITGAIRRSWNNISLADAERIITSFCQIAEDEECTARISTLRATYEKDDGSQNAGFGPFYDILVTLKPEMSTDQQNETIKKIRMGVYAALDDFTASVILNMYPNLEIDNSRSRHIVIFDTTVEEVAFPQEYNNILKETIRSVQRKSVLLDAAPVPPIQEVWDPVYQQMKYSISFRHVGKANQIITTDPGRLLLTRDELIDRLRGNASYFHKAGKLDEAVHAIVDSYTRFGFVESRIGTETEGLVYLPTKDDNDSSKLELVLSGMDRPAKPTQQEARDCINIIKQVKDRFYSQTEIASSRFSHFLKIGIVAPVDFARRQSGAVEQFGIIPRNDLGGWTDSGKTYGYAAIPLRIYGLPLNKGVSIQGAGTHFYVVGSGSVDSPARFIEQTRWTTMPIILDEADRYSEWEEDREARRILSMIKNSTQITNPRDILTSDSEQNLKPSCAYPLLTHNSALIQEDGFNKRCIGHEFTTKDEIPVEKQEDFKRYWAKNGHTFAAIGRHCLNWYLDNPDVLNNPWLDIAKTLLRSFYVDVAGLSEDEFPHEWDSWLCIVVESSTSKAGLIEARKANLASMLREMINDGWVRHRQAASVYISKHIRNEITAGELDYNSGKARESIDNAIATATFAEKVEALVKMGVLTHLVWHDVNNEITIDSSIVDEMRRSRWRIYRVSHVGMAELLDFPNNKVYFPNEKKQKRVIHVSIDKFAEKLAPRIVDEVTAETEKAARGITKDTEAA